MTTTDHEKTPSADLAGYRAEGLNPTPIKEQDHMHQSTVPTRLNFGDLTIDVQPVVDHIEVTTIAGGRATHGLALDPGEARKLASALLDASAPAFGHADAQEIDEHVAVARRFPVEIPVSDLAAGTVTDIFRFAQDHDMSSGDVMRAVEEYIDGMAEAESLTPAQWCKLWRQIMQEGQ